MTLVHWVEEQYLGIKYLDEVDKEIVTEFIGEKLETCQPNTVKALLAALRKLQEGLFARGWIEEDIVPDEWDIEDNSIPRGAYLLDDAERIAEWVAEHNPEYGQALRVILSCATRIDELYHLRSDKIFLSEDKVELLGKGGKTRRIRFLRRDIFEDLDRSKRFIYLTSENGESWKDGLERIVRRACETWGFSVGVCMAFEALQRVSLSASKSHSAIQRKRRGVS